MSFLLKFAVKIAANVGALAAATRYIPGFEIAPWSPINLDVFGITPLAQPIILGAVGLALANFIARPFLKVLDTFLPLITFGILSIALNAGILYFADLNLPQLTVSGWKPLVWGAVLLGIVNAIL